MMRGLTFLILIIWATQLCSQDVEVYDDFEDYKSHLFTDPNSVYVINYWATWCAPCVKEMPFFEQLNESYKDKNVRVVLVSIDFKDQFEKRLMPFVKEKKLKSRLIHMTDPDANKWIDEVDPSWSGAIPATQFISGDNVKFMERSFHSFNDLKLELDKFLKNIN